MFIKFVRRNDYKLEEKALLLEQDYELLMLSYALKINDVSQIEKSKERLKEIYDEHLIIKIMIKNFSKKKSS